MRGKETRSRFRGLLTALCIAALLPAAYAYDQDSTNEQDNCAACHGDFRDSPYTEMGLGGQTWTADLMEVHSADMVSGDCNVCHNTGGRFPVQLNASRGGAGLSAISCTGCHGRALDGSGVGTEGYGAGLRQHHWNANRVINTPAGPQSTRVCGDCHERADLGGLTDADPANFAVVGEQVQPPYYAEDGGAGAHVNIPDDPCNDNGREDIDGALRGNDNDGDLVYDMADTDCSGVVATPGEASGPTLNQLLVTAFDGGLQTLTVSYDPPCVASDNSLVVGSLGGPFAFTYAGDSECAIGNSGSYLWDFSLVPGSAFFLVVGNDGTNEGAYGESTGGAQRPQDATCAFTQSLADRCD